MKAKRKHIEFFRALFVIGGILLVLVAMGATMGGEIEDLSIVIMQFFFILWGITAVALGLLIDRAFVTIEDDTNED